MNTWMRVAFLVAVLCASAVAAHAQTPVSSSSLTGDPTIIYRGDPPCSPPFCYDLSYTGSVPVNLFFAAPSPYQPDASSFNCMGTSTLICGIASNGLNDFLGVNLAILQDQSFSISVTGGSVSLTIPTELACLNGCTPGSTVTINPVPEPPIALLYFTGLLLLGYVGRKTAKVHRARKLAGSLQHGPAV